LTVKVARQLTVYGIPKLLSSMLRLCGVTLSPVFGRALTLSSYGGEAQPAYTIKRRMAPAGSLSD
ncbi:hypothetical protein P7K49_008175, partial [Saguinus oedipus]